MSFLINKKIPKRLLPKNSRLKKRISKKTLNSETEQEEFLSGFSEDVNSIENDDSASSVEDNSEIIQINLKLNKKEALKSIFLFYLKHNCSWIQLENLCKLQNSLLGKKIFPETKYLLKTIFNQNLAIEFHIFCKICELYIGKYSSNKSLNCCPSCGYVVDLLRKDNDDFFVYFPLEPLLCKILEKHSDSLKPRVVSESDNISDICDGILYQRLVKSSEENFVSLTINTDGVNVHNSNTKSLWPIMSIVNELPISLRYKEDNMLIHALWFGAGAPPMRIYMKPFVDDIKNVDKTKIELSQSIKIVVVVLMASLDTLAKCKVQGLKQFNGYYGCGYCLHPGEIVNRQVRYTNKENILLRTEIDSLKHLECLERNKTKEAFGFKMCSPLLELDHFNIITSFPIDYLHNCLLGVTRMMLCMWMNSNHHNMEFYIGTKLWMLNHRLLAIKPPSTITRKPRSIKDRCSWKASEWRSWLLYYRYFISCLI